MSVTYSSQKYRRTGLDKGSAPSKDKEIKEKVLQLKEIYPTWSDEDLDSLLREVNNDLETAVIRISEGHAEQWVSSSRKKDKRTTGGGGVTQNKDTYGGWDREKGDTARGARGGRAGRGGRGGLRGTGRGGHREANGRHASSPAPQQTSQAPTPAFEAATTDAWGQDAAQDASAAAWGVVDDTTTSASTSAPQPAQEAASTSGEMLDTGADVWGNGASVDQGLYAPATATKSALKTPATSKMSWAQIAKPQDKPKPVASPAPPPPVPTEPPEPSSTDLEPEPVAQEDQGWEEPTTVQEPIWDDEPQAQASVPATSDAWTDSEAAEISEAPPVPEETKPEPAPEPQSESEPAPVPSAFPAQLGLQQKTGSPIVPPAKPATPVSYARSLTRGINRFKTTDQAVVMPSTFGSSVEKLGMQFGSVNLGDDDSEPKNPEPTASEVPPVAADPEPVREAQLPPAPVATSEPEPPSHAPMSTTTQAPLTSHSLFQQTIPHQQQQAQPSPLSSLQSAQTASLLSSQMPSQSSVASQTSISTANSTPLTSFATQQSTPSSQSSVSPYQQHAASHAQPQSHATQTPSQIPSQSHLHQQFQQYPSQLDASISAQSPPSQQQSSIHQGLGGHTSYFRQPGQDFFHAPTPPAGQAQDSPYGSFAPLSQQVGHQAQGSHLGGFASDQFGYNDGQRGFYDSYGQQSSFGSRNALGHDDVGKGLPANQQASQANNGLPQSATQPGSQQASQQPQSSAQPQAPTTGQPQQGYAPLPYYYNPYQASQYYGPPFTSGYSLGQYGNRYPGAQPPMFQPPSASSGSPANAKGPNTVQPQYTQGLYGQHTSPAYDDGYHSQVGHAHAQSIGGLPGSDYSKQLYGGQGIPGFMQSGGAGGPGGAPGLGQRATGTGAGGSPENAYKPYAGGPSVGAKDAGGAQGVGGGISGSAQGGLGASAGTASARGAGVQQQAHQGFYGSNRFAGTPGAGGAGGPGGPGQHQQSHQHGQQGVAPGQAGGYPQGAGVGADSSFYYQRGPAQQQPYWQ